MKQWKCFFSSIVVNANILSCFFLLCPLTFPGWLRRSSVPLVFSATMPYNTLCSGCIYGSFWVYVYAYKLFLYFKILRTNFYNDVINLHIMGSVLHGYNNVQADPLLYYIFLLCLIYFVLISFYCYFECRCTISFCCV